MASTDPSRRASEASSSEISLVDPSVVAKLLPKKDSIPGKVKIKKPPPKPKAEKDDDNPLSPDSPLINDIDPDLRATFPTGRPMEDKPDLLQCKHCKKPMLKAVAASHMALCLQRKNERAQRKKEQKEAARKAREAREKGNKDADGDAEMEDTVTVNPRGGADGEDSVNGDKTIKTGKKAAAGTSDKSKKRKADTEGDKEPKKKKTKKEIEAAKPKIPKPKGPVDVEKQCGVLLPNGAFCARSLTCKSHAMGAKRSVPGRSLPYDMLLAAYQKKNQAKQQNLVVMVRLKLIMSSTPEAPRTPRGEKREVTPDSTLCEARSISSKVPSRTVPRPSTPVPEYPHIRRHPQFSQLRPVFSTPSLRAPKRKVAEIDSPVVPLKKRCMLRLNPPRRTEAALDANAPLPDDIDPSGPVDSDEEKEAVMAGIARSRAQPLAQHIHISLRKRCQANIIRDMVRGVFNGPRGVYGTPNMMMGMGTYANYSNAGINVETNTEGAEVGERKLSVAQQVGMAVANQARAANEARAVNGTANGAGGAPVRKASTSSLIPLDLEVPTFN